MGMPSDDPEDCQDDKKKKKKTTKTEVNVSSTESTEPDDDSTTDDTDDSSPPSQGGSSKSTRVQFEMTTNPKIEPPSNEKWFIACWRPAMAWLYMAVIAFDFILAPVASMIIPLLPYVKGATYIAWHPITVEGGGLIHITFGAVLGVTAWGRTKEKTSETSSANGG